MHPRFKQRLIECSALVYLRDGLKELNKRLALVWGSNVAAFKEWEQEFQHYMEVTPRGGKERKQ